MSTTAKQTPLLCSGHSRPVRHLMYSNTTPDGFFLVSACHDGKPMLRNGITGDWIGTFLGHKGAVWTAVFDSAALKVATASADFTARVWDALTGTELHSFEHQKVVKACDLSSDSTRLYTGGMEKLIRVFDLGRPDAPALATLEGHQDSIKVVLAQNENTLISTGDDGVLRVWDLRTGQQSKKLLAKASIGSIELSRCGKFLTTAADKNVCFWNAETYEAIKEIAMPVTVNSASLHPIDRSRFVVGGQDFYARVYEYESGKELEVHKGHHGPVHCIRYAPDGETFATGSEDGTVRIWQNSVKPYGLWQAPGTSEEAAAAAVSSAAAAAAAATAVAGGAAGTTASTSTTSTAAAAPPPS